MFATRWRAAELGVTSAVLRDGLFDAIVIPSLLHGAEVWGTAHASPSTGVQPAVDLLFAHLRHLLQVPATTSRSIMLAELGRAPLEAAISERVLRFWQRTRDLPPERVAAQAWAASSALAQERAASGSSSHADARCYAEEVHSLLHPLGLAAGDSLVTWRAGTATARVLRHHLSAMPTAGPWMTRYLEVVRGGALEGDYVRQPYLSLHSPALRQAVALFRCGESWLEVCRLRGVLPRSQRTCAWCVTAGVQLVPVGDESHTVFACGRYAALRARHAAAFQGQGDGAAPSTVAEFLAGPSAAVAAFLLDSRRVAVGAGA